MSHGRVRSDSRDGGYGDEPATTRQRPVDARGGRDRRPSDSRGGPGGGYDRPSGGDGADDRSYSSYSEGDVSDPEAPEILKEGWLTKSNPRGQHWKRRWCVLTPLTFSYYDSEDKKDKALKGAFEVSLAELKMGWDLDKKSPATPFVFQVTIPSRTYYFCAETEDDRADWFAAFEDAVDPYDSQYSGSESRSRSRSYSGSYSRSGSHSRSRSRSPSPSGSEGPPRSREPSPSPSPAPSAQASAAGAPDAAGGAGDGGDGAERSPAEAKAALRAARRESQRQASSSKASRASGDQSTIRFTVSIPDGRKLKMVTKESKIATLTVAKIIRNVAKVSGLDASAIALKIGDTTLLDDWTGAEFGLTEMSLLRVVDHTEEQQPEADAASGAAAPDDATAAAAAASAGAAQAESDTRHRIERRVRFKKRFGECVRGAGRSAEAAELRAAVRGDPELSAFAKRTELLAELDKLAESGSTLTWEAFAATVRRAEQRATSKAPPAPPAGAAASGEADSRQSVTAASRTSTDKGEASANGGAGGGGVVAGDGSGRAVTQLTLSVAVADGGSGDIVVKVGDDPKELAVAFAAKHGLEGVHVPVLAEEIRHALLDVQAKEIEALRSERDLVASRLALMEETQGEVLRDGPSTVATRYARKLADTEHQAAATQRELEGVRARLERTEAQLRAAQSAAGGGAAAGGGDAAALATQLELAQTQIGELEEQLALAKEELQEKEETLRASTFEMYVNGTGRADASNPFAEPSAAFDRADADGDGTLSRSEFRNWAAEKAKLMAQANDDRERLVAENKRLRASISASSEDLVRRFGELEDDNRALRLKLEAVERDLAKSQAESASAYKRWQEESRQWAAERARLTEKVSSQSAALQMSAAASTSGLSSSTGAAAAGGDSAVERDALLKNWNEETDILVTIYREDKAAWEAEKARLQAELDALRRASS